LASRPTPAPAFFLRAKETEKKASNRNRETRFSTRERLEPQTSRDCSEKP
jgi:hypothetical protein